MNRAESVVVGLVVGITCPLLLFVFCWWTAAALSIYHVLSLPVSVIIVAAFTGLGIGMILDIIWLKHWVRRFYTANIYFIIAVYLSLSVVALAFFMGLPIGNIVLGMLAGVYVGRKQFHTGSGGSGCQTCSDTGWLEILGSGSVDPEVFKSVGYDPEKVTGFAFGMGVERIAMLKWGINDIRIFFENDIRFLKQF